MNEELRRFRAQFDEIQQTVKRHEATIAAKQRDVTDLESKRSAFSKARETSDRAQTALQIKVDGLAQDLALRDRERQTEVASRQRVEKELDDLRKIMAAKSSEDVKKQEADKSREMEMARLREQVLASQQALDDQRKAAHQLANKLKVDVEGLQHSHQAAQRDLKATQAALRDREAEFVSLQLAADQAQAAKRQVEADLRTVREQVSVTEDKLRTTQQARDVGYAARET